MHKLGVRGNPHPETPASPPTEPIFTSAHAALKFALNFTHGTLKNGVLAGLQGGGGDGRGLGGLDGAAQSGMILAELSCLETVRRRAIEARLSPQTSPCACRSPCCRGSREHRPWAEAIDWLTQYVLVEGLTGTISHHRLRRSLVVRHFVGPKESFLEIANTCGVHRTTASEYYKAVVERLRAEERAGNYEIEDRLKKAGIVPPS